MKRYINGVTLVELIIASALSAGLILLLTAVLIFSRRQASGIDRAMVVQTEASIALEHISRQVIRAIGSINIADPAPLGRNPVQFDPLGLTMSIYVDEGLVPDSVGDGRWNTQGDHWIGYTYQPAVDPANQRIVFCTNCAAPPCNCNNQIISTRIFAPAPAPAVVWSRTDNYITLSVTATWDGNDPLLPPPPSPENPVVIMQTRIKMPSVSTR